MDIEAWLGLESSLIWESICQVSDNYLLGQWVKVFPVLADQYNLRTCQKYTFFGVAPDLHELETLECGLALNAFTSPPGESETTIVGHVLLLLLLL